MPISLEERAQVLAWIDESHQEFLSAIDSLSDAQWNWKPAPERWSIGEIAEHVVVAEGFFFAVVRKALAGPRNPAWAERTEGKTELLVRVMASRQDKAAAPEPFVPRQRLTCTQVQERFKSQRADFVTFVRETQHPLKEHTLEHPFPVFGTLNAYQWLIYVPLHTMRHGQQIADVKAASGYPAAS